MSIINRGGLPTYSAVEQRMIARKKTKTAKRTTGPTKRYARGKVKK